LEHASSKPVSRLRRYGRWAVRIVGGIVGLIALVLLGGTIYQKVAGDVDLARYPAPGRLVDIGGRSMHIYCVGEGSPTVVLDAGLGWGLGAWRLVQPGAAEITQVCSYDRAGYGWSDAAPAARTSSEVSKDLHTILQKAGVATPVVLVGHSIGGLYAQHFAATYPSEVAGLILVESSHADQGDSASIPQMVSMLKLFTAIGVNRLTLDYGDEAMNAVYLSNRTMETPPREMAAIPTSSAEVRGSPLSLGTKPLIVMSSVQNDRDSTFHRMQLDLMTRSSNSTRILVDSSGHRVQIDQPGAVIGAIRDVVGWVRGG